MRVEIVNTGTELLLGNVLNTHAAWFGRELFKLGLRISRQTTVPDGEAMRDAIHDACRRAEIVILTGGLGPTSDDLTREITAEVLGLELQPDAAACAAIKEYFSARGRPMASSNLKQALAPMGAEMLPNPHGTAPGVYLPPCAAGWSQAAVFLLPGPPRELYPMFEAEVRPRLQALIDEDPPALLEMKFTGIGESDFHQGVDAALAAIDGLEYGYCAHIGEVDLRLIGPPALLGHARSIALHAFGPYLVSDDGSSLEAVVLRELAARGMKIATAESCTGGLIASRLTDVPGSSAVFDQGWITYANAAKCQLLGVDPAAIECHGAVSEIVACQMADGALTNSHADVALSVTGIAGPDGGSADKPVGTAWIGLAARGTPTTAIRVYHPRNRHDFKLAVSQVALDRVRRWLADL